MKKSTRKKFKVENYEFAKISGKKAQGIVS